MEVIFSPGEAVFLTFKMSNGSGWLTSHRLIIVEHNQASPKKENAKMR
jgi:hypothetical protein